MLAALGVPARSWWNYERTDPNAMPAEVMLRFITTTDVEPLWLLQGTGPKYRVQEPAVGSATHTPQSL